MYTHTHTHTHTHIHIIYREAKDSEEIVRSLFPREDEARYMRVLTQIPMEGGDMRYFHWLVFYM